MTKIYSRNKNVFLRDKNGQWSRLLFFKSMGTDKLVKEFAITVNLIRIILTPENKEMRNIDAWNAIKKITLNDDVFYDRNQHIHVPGFVEGGLPNVIYETMCQWLPVDIAEQLVHGNYLPFIDFRSLKFTNNEAIYFHNAHKMPPTQQEWLSSARQNGGGSGILLHDIESEWIQYVADYTKKINILCGLNE